jgi:hypothetical protein
MMQGTAPELTLKVGFIKRNVIKRAEVAENGTKSLIFTAYYLFSYDEGKKILLAESSYSDQWAVRLCS